MVVFHYKKACDRNRTASVLSLETKLCNYLSADKNCGMRQKHATNTLQRHLKTWRHVCPLFSHRVCHTLMAVPQSAGGPLAVKMQHVRRITERSPKFAACLAKIAAIRILALPAQTHWQTIRVWHIFLSKSATQILLMHSF